MRQLSFYKTFGVSTYKFISFEPLKYVIKLSLIRVLNKINFFTSLFEIVIIYYCYYGKKNYPKDEFYSAKFMCEISKNY